MQHYCSDRFVPCSSCLINLNWVADQLKFSSTRGVHNSFHAWTNDGVKHWIFVRGLSMCMGFSVRYWIHDTWLSRVHVEETANVCCSLLIYCIIFSKTPTIRHVWALRDSGWIAGGHCKIRGKRETMYASLGNSYFYKLYRLYAKDAVYKGLGALDNLC